MNATTDILSDLKEQAASAGWPADLVDRATAAKISPREISRLVGPRPTPSEVVEKIVAAATSLVSGRIRGRELTRRDLDGFSALWASSAEVIGDWLVTVHRGPNPLAQFRLQDDASISVLELDGEIVACMGWSTMNVILDGRPSSILLAHALRVSDSRRREGLGDIVRRFPMRALMKPVQGQVMYMRRQNVGVDGFLKGVLFRDGDDRPQYGATVQYFTAKDAPNDARIRSATLADLEACADLINRTHAGLDLFRPVTAQWLELCLQEGAWGEKDSEWPPVYSLSDFHVVEDAGRIVACAGFWDRGRDVRESWVSRTTGDRRTFAYSTLLDMGVAAGCEAALATLIRHLNGIAHGLGRDALAVPLQHLPAVLEELADLERREEVRLLEWSPFRDSAPRRLGDMHIDMRYW